MPQVVFLPHPEICPDGMVLELEPGANLLDEALHNDIDIEHACEMSCACTTCHVIVREGFDTLLSMPVDADGLLSVSAKEVTTGIESSVTVKPSYGLEEEQVTQMLKDSIAHAHDDVAARQLREKQVDAEGLLSSIENALSEDGDKLLSAAEREEIEAALQRLREVAGGDDGHAITREIDKAGQASNEFATRRMEWWRCAE